MDYRTLGRTGVEVSQLCFGTMSFGGDADAETSAALYRRCRDAGINFFDTANVYSAGRSEEILGDLIKDERDQLVITSKVCGGMGPGPNQRGLSRRHIALQVEDTLRRLQTDRLDFYFVHNFDKTTPVEDTLRTLDDLVRQGKILYPAVSNWAAWQIALALGHSACESLASFACVQPMYNLVKRQAEVEILPLAQDRRLGVIPYSPLGAGLLTGKYGVEKRPPSGRLLEKDTYIRRYSEGTYYEIAERFIDYARQEGTHPATLAVAWVAKHPAVTAPIIGARNLEQLEPSLQATEFDMSEEMRAEISALSVEPPLATDRSDDRAA